MKLFYKALPIFLLLCTAWTFAQAQVVKGTVTDESGTPLIGANVLAKGTTVGAVTETDGTFELKLPAAGTFTLVVSYTGCTSAENMVTVNVGTQALDFQLAEGSTLDEVVVTGVFDKRTRMESSIAITTLKAREIQRLAPVSSADLLKNVPGVFVNSSLGEIRNTVYSRGVSVGSNDGASGYYYVSMQEDGLPVTNATYDNFGPDYFLRHDLTTGRLEAVRGGTASILGNNAPGGIFNYVSKTGGTKFGGEAAVKFGLEGDGKQPYYRADVVFGGPLNAAKDLTYNIGGFYRQSNGARYPGYPMNNGGQVKGNLFKDYGAGSLKLYVKYLSDHNAWYEFLPTTGFDDPKLPDGVEQTNSVLIPEVQSDFRVNNTDEILHYDSRDKIHSKDRAVGLNWEHQFGEGWTVQNNARYSDKQALWNTTAVVYPFAVDGIVWHAINGTIAKFGTYDFKEHGSGASLASVGQLSNIDANGNFIGFLFPVYSSTLPGQSVQPNSLFFNPLFYQDNHLKEFIDQFTITKKLKNMSFTAGALFAKSNVNARQAFAGVTYGTIDTPHPTTTDITYTDFAGQTFQMTNPDGILGGSGGSAGTNERSGNQNQTALFFGHNWEINQQLNFDWGVRYEKFSVDGSNTPNVAGVDTTGGTDNNLLTLYDNGLFLPGDTYTYDESFNTLSLSAGLNYQFNDRFAVYGRYSQGEKAPDMGLFINIDNDIEEKFVDVKSQKVQQFELGLKGRSGRSTFFVTPFLSLLSNVYSQQFGQETADLSSTYSAPPLYNEYQTFGVEVESNINISLAFHKIRQ